MGISNYEKWPDLPRAARDAKDVASQLKDMGFEVNLALDPSAKELRKALSEVVYQAGKEKNRALLFNVVRAAPVDISEKSVRPVRQFITAGGAGEQVPDQSVFKLVFLQGISGDCIFVAPRAPEKKMAAKSVHEAAIPTATTQAEKSGSAETQNGRTAYIPGGQWDLLFNENRI